VYITNSEVCCLTVPRSRHNIRRETSQQDIISVATDFCNVQQRMRRDDFRFTMTSVYYKPCDIRARLTVRLALVNVRYEMLGDSDVSRAI